MAPLEQEAILRPFDRPAMQLNPSANLPSHPPEARAATGSKFWNPAQPNLRHVLPDPPSQETTSPDEILLNPQADGLAPGTESTAAMPEQVMHSTAPGSMRTRSSEPSMSMSQRSRSAGDPPEEAAGPV